MSILSKLGRATVNALSSLEERNRRTAKLNRIRAVLKREEKAARQELLALGRYYYQNLRDPEDATAELHCAELDKIEKRMDVAVAELELHYKQMVEEKARKAEVVDLEDIECHDAPPSIQTAAEKMKVQLDEIKENAAEQAQEIKSSVGETVSNVAEKSAAIAEDLKEASGSIKNDIAEAAAKVKKDVSSTYQSIREEIRSDNEKPQADAAIHNAAQNNSKSASSSDSIAADKNENDNLPFDHH